MFLLDNQGYRHTLRLSNINCFSKAAVVSETPSILRLYALCLPYSSHIRARTDCSKHIPLPSLLNTQNTNTKYLVRLQQEEKIHVCLRFRYQLCCMKINTSQHRGFCVHFVINFVQTIILFLLMLNT